MKKLVAAFELAADHHEGQTKKGTSIAFIYHPMAVASIVLAHGGDETQAMAALLHDTIADGRVSRADLAARFGGEVAELAFAFSDPEMTSVNPSWRELREAYLAKLSRFEARTLLVMAAEELHDGGELVHDLKHCGWRTWERYPVPPADVLWYYDSLYKLFEQKLARAHPALVAEFRELVDSLRQLAA